MSDTKDEGWIDYLMRKSRNRNFDEAIGQAWQDLYRVQENAKRSMMAPEFSKQLVGTYDPEGVESRLGKPRDPKVNLGPVGDVVRHVGLEQPLAKKLFERFWLGKGDYRLKDKEFKELLTLMTDKDGRLKLPPVEREKDEKPPVDFHFKQNGKRYTAKKRSFYGTDAANALGSAWIVVDETERPVGIFDIYDFNEKTTGRRTDKDEWNTMLTRWASHLDSRTKDFTVRYGVTPEIWP